MFWDSDSFNCMEKILQGCCRNLGVTRPIPHKAMKSCPPPTEVRRGFFHARRCSVAVEDRHSWGPGVMSDETIPLYDGELSGATIIPEGGAASAGSGTPSGTAQPPRPKRRNPRRPCHGVLVCFSPRLASGCVEHVLCPVLNISKGGIEIEYDREVATGAPASVAYRTISQRSVRVTGAVRHCSAVGNGRFRIGVELSRFLDCEELKPAKALPGRDVASGVRARKLRPMATPDSEAGDTKE